jgi:putative transposase
MKFRLIEDQREAFPVRVMCDVMGVSPRAIVADVAGPKAAQGGQSRALTEIPRVHLAYRGRYGAPRIYAALHAEGTRRAATALNASRVITASGQ